MYNVYTYMRYMRDLLCVFNVRIYVMYLSPIYHRIISIYMYIYDINICIMRWVKVLFGPKIGYNAHNHYQYI